jgi:hypothetical protein
MVIKLRALIISLMSGVFACVHDLERKKEKKEIPYKEGKLKDIGSH